MVAGTSPNSIAPDIWRKFQTDLPKRENQRMRYLEDRAIISNATSEVRFDVQARQLN
jgi:hypothetical protein